MCPPPGQAPSQSTLALARRHQPKCASSTNKGAHEHTQGKAKPKHRKRKNPRHHWTQSEVSSLSVAVSRTSLFWVEERERARVGRIWTGSKIVPREAAGSKSQVARKRSKVSERTNSGSCSKGLAALRLPALGPALRLERSPRFGPLITSPCSGSTDTRVHRAAGCN